MSENLAQDLVHFSLHEPFWRFIKKEHYLFTTDIVFRFHEIPDRSKNRGHLLEYQ